MSVVAAAQTTTTTTTTASNLISVVLGLGTGSKSNTNGNTADSVRYDIGETTGWPFAGNSATATGSDGLLLAGLAGDGAAEAGGVPTELNYYYAALELTVALLATVGNAAVITVFCRERRLRKRTNYYIVSLAMADFLVGLLGIPFAVLASVGLPRNLYGCLLTLSTLVVLCTCSIFCLVAVSIDRYWAILYPLAYSRNVRTRTAIGIISACWMIGIIIGFLPIFGWRSATAGPEQACLFVEVMNYDYLVFLFFFTIVLPALMLLFFYAHIYTVIMKQVRKTITLNPAVAGGGGGKPPHKPHLISMSRSQGGTMLRVLGAARKREVKATQNLSVIVLFFMICWLPLYTINCIKAFCHECVIPPWATLFLIILSHLNSAMNPLLYAYHLKDFRAALKTLLCTVVGIKMPAEEMNYQFSVHSQNRLASRLEKRSSSMAFQPKIYIDSPIYLRQQASSRTTSPTSPIASTPTLFRQHSQVASGGNHAAEGQMWRILEVSVDESSPQTKCHVNYGASDDASGSNAHYDKEYKSLPTFADGSYVVCSQPAVSAARRRSVTFSDLVMANNPTRKDPPGEEYRPLPAFAEDSYAVPSGHNSNSMVQLRDVCDPHHRDETREFIDNERRSEARSRVVAEIFHRDISPPPPELQMRVALNRPPRPRRSRSTSWEEVSEDCGPGRYKKLSRSWSVLHRTQNEEGAPKHSFS